MISDQPLVVVVSGPVGSGKGTIVHALAHELGLTWVPTHTTRPRRPDDSVLSRRIFSTEANFERHRARREFLEWIKLAGHYYGLLQSDLDGALNRSRPVIVELTVEGGLKVAKRYPNSLLLYLTSDERERRQRIAQRHMSDGEVARRMKTARRDERIARQSYDYVIENVQDYPDAAICAVKSIIAERLATPA